MYIIWIVIKSDFRNVSNSRPYFDFVESKKIKFKMMAY